MPERFQLRRTKGWRMPANGVKCARPGLFANPYRWDPGAGVTVVNLRKGKWSSRPQTKADVVAAFRVHVYRDNPALMRRICEELPGRDLGCFCAVDDPDCHVDVLLAIANRKEIAMEARLDPEALEKAAAALDAANQEKGPDLKAINLAADLLREAAAEVHMWRTNQVLVIERHIREIGRIDPSDLNGMAHFITNILKPDMAALAEALAGDVHVTRCEPCGKHVKKGQFVVRYADVGEVHAECAGVSEDQMFVGGKMPLDPSMIDLEEGEEPPVDPHLVVFVADDMLGGPERMAKTLNDAQALIAAWDTPLFAGGGEEDED